MLAGGLTLDGQEAGAIVQSAEVVSPANPARVVSPRVAALLTASLPKLDVPNQAAGKSERAEAAAEKPSNGIVRLPRYLLRERKLPTPEEVRTRRGLEKYAMNKYLGSTDSFSRGVLNYFTIADAWKHVPLLGRFPWFNSNEATAMDMYWDDEWRKKMSDLISVLAIKPRRGEVTVPPMAKSAADQTVAAPADVK